jgi:hypothetical protein
MTGMLQESPGSHVSLFQVKIVKSSQGGVQRVRKLQCSATVKADGKKKRLTATMESWLKKLQDFPAQPPSTD